MRIGVTCSKKVGNAVARNRAKRRLREIARLELAQAIAAEHQAEADLARVAGAEELRALIGEVLGLDPRPAYRQGEEPDRVYGMRLDGYDVRWRVMGDRIEVQAVQAVDPI